MSAYDPHGIQDGDDAPHLSYGGYALTRDDADTSAQEAASRHASAEVTSGLGAWSIPVVFDVESDDAPMPVGVLIGQEEGTVNYLGSDGETHYAPGDCVRVVRVTVPKGL